MASALAAMLWSREPWLNRDQVRSKLFASGLGVYRQDRNIGWGAINAYKAFGGFIGLSVSGGATDLVAGESATFTANPIGDGPFDYTWNTGAKTRSIALTCGEASGTMTATVTVRDTVDGTTYTRSASANCTMPPTDICYKRPWLCD
jgi:hypothetical protein